MSWTVPKPTQPTDASRRLEAAIRKACASQVLMFASSPDAGHFTNDTFPTVVDRNKIFFIGAAHDDGTAFRYTGQDVDFILPGVDVNVDKGSKTDEPQTGSSIATALAAGLAGVIIYCFKISALAGKTTAPEQTSRLENSPGPHVNDGDVARIGQHEAMMKAFESIGRINEEKFIQVWDLFELAARELTTMTDETKLECVGRLCRRLMAGS